MLDKSIFVKLSKSVLADSLDRFGYHIFFELRFAIQPWVSSRPVFCLCLLGADKHRFHVISEDGRLSSRMTW